MLTPRQAMFAREYLVDLNAAAAARRAGYSARRNNSTPYALLQNPHVRAAIADGMAARSQRVQVTADMVVEQLYRIGFRDIREMFGPDGAMLHPKDLSDTAAACVHSLKMATRNVPGTGGAQTEHIVEISCESRLGALNTLAKHLGMFSEKTNDAPPVVLKISDDDAAL